MTDPTATPRALVDVDVLQALAGLLAGIAGTTTDEMHAASARAWSRRLETVALEAQHTGGAETVVLGHPPAHKLDAEQADELRAYAADLDLEGVSDELLDVAARLVPPIYAAARRLVDEAGDPSAAAGVLRGIATALDDLDRP